MTRLLSALLPVVLVLAVGDSRASAAPPKDPPPGFEGKTTAEAEHPEPKAKKSKKEHAEETKEAREQRVVSFVKEHNPELAKLLAHLKKTKPEQFDHAVRDLAKTVTSLTNVKSRDARLYELELKGWQAKTRVQMLVAQSRVADKKDIADKKDLEPKLRAAVEEELKVKADELAYRRDKTGAWYDRQIKRLQDDREELVEARLKKLLGGKDGARKTKRAAKTE
jgi:hypothetical protein